MITYLSPSECCPHDPFDAMDNAGWYVEFGPGEDVYGPYDTRAEAEAELLRLSPRVRMLDRGPAPGWYTEFGGEWTGPWASYSEANAVLRQAAS